MIKLNREDKYLDYGGGYGILVRLVRDYGFNFLWSDKYCENLFSNIFVADDNKNTKFGAITAFEVFEHLVHPLVEFEQFSKQTDVILFSTELSNRARVPLQDWWYIGPDHGQHIAIYHIKTLQYMADKFGLHLHSYKNLHMFSKEKYNPTLYKLATTYRFSKIYNALFYPQSLTEQDHEQYKKITG